MSKSISNSFTREEIKVIDQVLKLLTRGGDPNVLIRRKAYWSFLGKISKMCEKVKAIEHMESIAGDASVDRITKVMHRNNKTRNNKNDIDLLSN